MIVLATKYLTGCNYQIGYDLISQSASNNTSTLKVYGVLNVTGSYISWSSGTARVWNTTNNLNTSYSNGSYVVTQETIIVPHNSDGNKSVYIGGALTTSYVSSGEVGGTATLPKIDRYPQIINAPNFNDEENPTVTYSTVSGFNEAMYKICISLDGTSDSIAFRDVELSDGEYTFNLTTAERELLRSATPNSNELNVTFILRTTNNGTNYDSKVVKKMSIINADPTFTHSEVELNQDVIDVLGSGATTVVQNESSLEVTINPTALKDATISSVRVSSGDYLETKTTSPYVFTVPITQQSIAVVVRDSRGNSVSGIIAKTLIEYAPVRLNIYDFEREDSTSSNIIVNMEADYVQKTFGSTANVPVIKWKLDDGSYITIPSSEYVIDTTNNKIRLVDYELTDALVYTSSGNFSLKISDLFSESEETGILVLKGIPTFDYGEHDLKVNGDLYIADVNGENPVNVKEELDKKNESYNLIEDGNEVKMNYQIDGSDVYAKKISFTTPSNESDYYINLNVSNLSKIVKMYGMVDDATLIPYVIWFGTTVYYTSFRVNGNQVIYRGSSAYGSKSAYLIVEYIKSS